ncbi:unnamed protein product, partial [marine sediment metagenome]
RKAFASRDLDRFSNAAGVGWSEDVSGAADGHAPSFYPLEAVI